MSANHVASARALSHVKRSWPAGATTSITHSLAGNLAGLTGLPTRRQHAVRRESSLRQLMDGILCLGSSTLAFACSPDCMGRNHQMDVNNRMKTKNVRHGFTERMGRKPDAVDGPDSEK